MKLKDLKTSVKLGGTFGSLVVVFLLIGGFSLYQMTQLGGLTKKMYKHPLTVSNTVRDIEIEIKTIDGAMKDIALAKERSQIMEAQKQIMGSEIAVNEFFKIIDERFLGDKKDVKAAEQLFNDWKKIRNDIIKLIKKGQHDEAAAMSKGAGAEHVGKLSEKIKGLVNFADEKGKSFNENAAKTETMTLIINGSVMILLVVLTIFLSLYISRLITRPLASGVQVADAMAEGDLTQRFEVEANDDFGQMGQAFNHSLTELENTVKLVMKAMEEYAGSADEITSGSNDLAIRTNQQATSITETSATMEQSANLVRQNSESSEDAKSVLEEFYNEIQQKMDLINNVTATMKEIDDSGKQIDKIVNVINDISFQTNLLALNAAVEAARAGEAGRGFAVVAAEVRNLAQKTAESSKTIQEIVNKNVESTNKGIKLVNETSEFFNANLMVVSDILDKVRSIADSSQEQTSGISQINDTITQLDRVINQNAELSEELSSSAKNLKVSSAELQELINRFRVG